MISKIFYLFFTSGTIYLSSARSWERETKSALTIDFTPRALAISWPITDTMELEESDRHFGLFGIELQKPSSLGKRWQGDLFSSKLVFGWSL